MQRVAPDAKIRLKSNQSNKHKTYVMKKALLFAAAAAFSVNMMAESQELYSQNFEKMTKGNFSSSVKNKAGVSPYYWSVDANGVSQISIEEDADHGKYLQIKQRTGDWNAGGAYSLFYTDDVKSVGEDGDRFNMESQGITKYSVEFDAALYTTLNAYLKGGATMTWAGPCMEFALLNPSFKAFKRCDYGLTNGSADYSYDNVIYIKQTNDNITSEMPEKDSYKMDEVVPFTLQTDEQGTEVNIPLDGSWNHWKVSVDRESYEVSLTVGDKKVASFKGDPDLASQILRGIYFRTGNCQSSDPSYIKLDNLKVTGEVTTGINEVNAEETTAADKKTVKYVKNGVLYISTPNGTVTAAGVAVK